MEKIVLNPELDLGLQNKVPEETTVKTPDVPQNPAQSDPQSGFSAFDKIKENLTLGNGLNVNDILNHKEEKSIPNVQDQIYGGTLSEVKESEPTKTEPTSNSFSLNEFSIRNSGNISEEPNTKAVVNDENNLLKTENLEELAVQTPPPIAETNTTVPDLPTVSDQSQNKVITQTPNDDNYKIIMIVALILFLVTLGATAYLIYKYIHL